MHETIFINCSGSNIYTTLGALNKLKKNIEKIKIWNVCGNASLILYFKLLGFNFTQIYEKLKNFNIINSLINGHSLFPENENEKENYIYEYLASHTKDTIINFDSTLEEIVSLTGITPCFIVWDRTKKDIVNLNPQSTPKIKLIDCIMATLTNMGVYKEYIISNNIYSSLENIECFPISHIYLKNLETLFYLINITQYIKEYSTGINLGPLKDNEDEFLLQKGEYNNYRIKKAVKKLPNQNNICKLFSVFSRGNSPSAEKENLYSLGNKMAEGFLKKEDTYEVYQKYLEKINSQN